MEPGISQEISYRVSGFSIQSHPKATTKAERKKIVELLDFRLRPVYAQVDSLCKQFNNALNYKKMSLISIEISRDTIFHPEWINLRFVYTKN